MSLCALSSSGMPFPAQQLYLWFIFFCASVQCVCMHLSFFLFQLYLWIYVNYAQWGAVNAGAYSLLSSTQSKPPVGTSVIAWHRERSMNQQLDTLTCPVWGRGIWNAAEINPHTSLYTSILTKSQVSTQNYCFGICTVWNKPVITSETEWFWLQKQLFCILNDFGSSS